MAAECACPRYAGDRVHLRGCAQAFALAADLHVTTTPEVLDELQRLVQTGLFGATLADCAEQLIRERLRELGSAAGRARVP